jgi:hypothetical protein
LDDIASPLFGERVTILETVAKIESCILMLDIRCVNLILEMFHIFLFVVSGDHPENVSTSMQAIMTCILDESDDIPELVSLILASLGREKEEVSSATRRLAMNVVEQCANKLQPCVTISSGDTNTWDEKDDSRTMHEEELISSSYTEGCDDLGVSTPKCNEALTPDESPLETNIISQELHMTEDQSSTTDTREHSYREPQQLAMQLKVSEDMCNVPTLGHHCITECYDD